MAVDPNTPSTGSYYVPGPDQPFGHPSTWPTSPAPAPSSQPPRRKSRAPLIAGLVTLGVLVAGGLAGGLWYAGRSRPTPSAAASPTPSWSSVTGADKPAATAAPRPDDPPGLQACARLAALEASTNQGTADPDKMQPIGELAATSSNFDIRFRGSMLVSSAKLARAAKGHDDEFRRTLEMMTAGTELAIQCVKDRYTIP